MNVAFTAVVVLFLASPGLACLYAIRSNPEAPTTPPRIAEDLPLGVLAASLFHLLWVLLFNGFGFLHECVFGTRLIVDAKSVVVLLSSQSGKDDELFVGALNALTSGPNLFYLATYFISICLFAWWVGTMGRELLVNWIPFIRWNSFYYLLSGRTPNGFGEDIPFDVVGVSAVVGDYLYWGVLADWYPDRAGNLKSLVLDLPIKRALPTKDCPNPEQEKLDVEFLVLDYEKCGDLAVRRIVFPAIANTQEENQD